ncbi:DUF1559 domain-containing protein [Bremerella cremea]|nr:DUF1559 domain-containing protein [Bremerella cremea]
MVGEANFSLLHELNQRNQEPGPLGPHAKPMEFPPGLNRNITDQAVLVPLGSIQKLLWANAADYRYGAPSLLLIQTVRNIDVAELKKTHELAPDLDLTNTFEIKPFGGGRLARMIAPNRIVIASSQEHMDTFVEFQDKPINRRKSGASLFSESNFIFRYAQRKRPDQEEQVISDEQISEDPILKIIGSLDRTITQLVFQASVADDHSLLLKLEGQFNSAEAAKDASLKYKMGKAMLDSFFELYLEDTKLPPTFDSPAVENWPHLVLALKQLLENAQVEVNGNDCVIQTKCDPDLYDTLVNIWNKMPQVTARSNDLFRLRKVLSALEIYHLIHGHYPPSVIFDEESGHARSWRVELLKLMQDDDLKDLYEQYRKDEPWNSEANLKLLDASVSVFSSSWETDPHAASFYYVLGEGTPFDDEEPNRDQITDPRSETVLIVSADRNIPWTMPEDLNFEDTIDLNKLGIWNNDQVLVGTADNRTWILLKDFSPESWQNILLKADGKRVKIPEQYRPLKRAK